MIFLGHGSALKANNNLFAGPKLQDRRSKMLLAQEMDATIAPPNTIHKNKKLLIK
jgi:hypothetical protein